MSAQWHEVLVDDVWVIIRRMVVAGGDTPSALALGLTCKREHMALNGLLQDMPCCVDDMKHHILFTTALLFHFIASIDSWCGDIACNALLGAAAGGHVDTLHALLSVWRLSDVIACKDQYLFERPTMLYEVPIRSTFQLFRSAIEWGNLTGLLGLFHYFGMDDKIDDDWIGLEIRHYMACTTGSDITKAEEYTINHRVHMYLMDLYATAGALQYSAIRQWLGDHLVRR